MTVYLVRHADAGPRRQSRETDDLRPLSARGAHQAEALGELLAGEPVKAILSSRFLRCVQTVEPLAARLGLAVEGHDALAEEASDDEVVDLVASLVGTDAVLCTHGNIVPVVLNHLRRGGTRFEHSPHDWKKASTWVLDSAGGCYASARYLPPPT